MKDHRMKSSNVWFIDITDLNVSHMYHRRRNARHQNELWQGFEMIVIVEWRGCRRGCRVESISKDWHHVYNPMWCAHPYSVHWWSGWCTTVCVQYRYEPLCTDLREEKKDKVDAHARSCLPVVGGGGGEGGRIESTYPFSWWCPVMPWECRIEAFRGIGYRYPDNLIFPSSNQTELSHIDSTDNLNWKSGSNSAPQATGWC